jgi:hypothetical protein
MNLARHAAVLWRFRFVAIAGAAIGLLLAILATYQVPSMKPRGTETWTATSQILVTQPGFPEGRVTLPEETIQGAQTTGGESVGDPAPKDQVTFADPARLSGLADLYARFLTSDEVLSKVPDRPKAERISASPFLASAGGQVLPVIQLAAMAPTNDGAMKLNRDVFKSLSTLIEQQQTANGIGKGQRIELKLIDAPEAALTSPRKKTAAILVLFLCLLGTIAVCHLLEGLRPQEQDAIDGIVDWDVALPDDDPNEEPARHAQTYELTGRRQQ